jgi:hypothetical protein
MQYPSKKQSWIEFINESMGNSIKNEAIDRNLNNVNYTTSNPLINAYHSTSSSLYHPSVRPPSFETSDNMNNKQQKQQQQNEHAYGK